MNKKQVIVQCPCGSGGDYDNCCGPLHREEVNAATAQELMRARYSAYATGNAGYIERTWLREGGETVSLDPRQKWIGLKITDSHAGQSGDSEGYVEFVARFRIDGKAHRLHEKSRFVCKDGCWYYIDGIVVEDQ